MFFSWIEDAKLDEGCLIIGLRVKSSNYQPILTRFSRYRHRAIAAQAGEKTNSGSNNRRGLRHDTPQPDSENLSDTADLAALRTRSRDYFPAQPKNESFCAFFLRSCLKFAADSDTVTDSKCTFIVLSNMPRKQASLG